MLPSSSNALCHVPAPGSSDLADYNWPGGWTLPANATFVIDASRTVRYTNVRGDWTDRAEPADVLARSVT